MSDKWLQEYVDSLNEYMTTKSDPERTEREQPQDTRSGDDGVSFEDSDKKWWEA